nr:NADH dehydrogenase subunit 4L [Scirtothrips hansoni]
MKSSSTFFWVGFWVIQNKKNMLMVFGVSMKFLLYYFVFIVSESAMGLSILVLSMKSFGSGNFRSMSLTKF